MPAVAAVRVSGRAAVDAAWLSARVPLAVGIEALPLRQRHGQEAKDSETEEHRGVSSSKECDVVSRFEISRSEPRLTLGGSGKIRHAQPAVEPISRPHVASSTALLYRMASQ